MSLSWEDSKHWYILAIIFCLTLAGVFLWMFVIRDSFKNVVLGPPPRAYGDPVRTQEEIPQRSRYTQDIRIYGHKNLLDQTVPLRY